MSSSGRLPADMIMMIIRTCSEVCCSGFRFLCSLDRALGLMQLYLICLFTHTSFCILFFLSSSVFGYLNPCMFFMYFNRVLCQLRTYFNFFFFFGLVEVEKGGLCPEMEHIVRLIKKCFIIQNRRFREIRVQ